MAAFVPDFVADAGNTRTKWGRCTPQGIETVAEWTGGPLPAGSWAVAGSKPQGRESLAKSLGGDVRVIASHREIPISAKVDFPDKVGHDRLLNALAARARYPGEELVVVSAGTAITVDVVDRAGDFLGGSILPGFRLLAKSLNDYTALLPLVDLPPDIATIAVPGRNTEEAIRTGIYWQAVGGVVLLYEMLAEKRGGDPRLILTGGDAALLEKGLGMTCEIVPTLTLEGVRIAAEALS